MPSTTFPKTTCFPFRNGVGTQVMKNWLPFVFGPEFCRTISTGFYASTPHFDLDTHRHRQQSRRIMSELEVLIRKILRSVDTDRTRAIAVQEVATLNHEILDHAVEAGVLVALGTAERILGLAGAKLAEVLCCARNGVCKEFHLDAAERLSAECDVEKHDGVRLSCHLRNRRVDGFDEV